MTPIRSLKTILILTVFFALTSCNFGNKKSEPVWSDLPNVTSLDNLKQTDFVITLENPISENKNIIYAPAFLYAWDKIKEELKSQILSDSTNSIDFNLLNKSISHQRSLTDNAYSATAAIIDGAIIAKASFNKTLPFETKLQALDEPINFGTSKVAAFGMYYYDEATIKFTQILYYNNDNNFILRLVPKDNQQEIILVKGLDKYQTLKDAIKLTDELVAQGIKEQTDSKLLWKYQIVHEDIFAIPAIKFNIATNYKNIEGQEFSTGDSKKHTVEVAYQRTGFIFNENGAVVESEAVIVTDSASAVPIITHPKKMIFDRPFLIILKRADKANPYFVMKVANTELLTKK
ncbi:MAG: hypothetical protein IPM95_04115 [Sphingobacteriales bacterium]|nr:hypothetical protein [Sphingobacteriales bacterium]